MNKKMDYRTYECTDSDPSEISDSDSDPDSIIADHISDLRFYFGFDESVDNHHERSDYEEPGSEYEVDQEIFEISDSGYGSDEYYSLSEHEESEETGTTFAEIYLYLTLIFEVLHDTLKNEFVKAYNDEDIENLNKIYLIFQHDSVIKMYKKIFDNK